MHIELKGKKCSRILSLFLETKMCFVSKQIINDFIQQVILWHTIKYINSPIGILAVYSYNTYHYTLSILLIIQKIIFK